MVIDFREIPSAKAKTGKVGQDDFELFAREFLFALGYTIIEGPDRGPDGQRDLIVGETRYGRQTQIRWLVSCKHNAHSNKSVRQEDEINILERLESHDCEGFLGFYSTIRSSGFNSILKGVKRRKEGAIFDNAFIESIIIGEGLEDLFCRFFPVSYHKWRENRYGRDSINLLKYFIQKEYSNYESFLMAIFVDYAYLLRCLRETNSLTDLLLKRDVTLVVEPVLNRFHEITIGELLTFKYSIDNNLKEEDIKPIGNVFHLILPSGFMNGLFDAHIYPHIQIGIGFGPVFDNSGNQLLGQGIYHYNLRKNYLFVDDNGYTLYKNLYAAIRSYLY